MEANSGYAVYAEFAEKILKLIERQSNGAVRIETVIVEPFSQLEHRLTRDDHIWFEEDKFGQKTFMAAELSDNEGNRLIIPYFGNLRQNLLETDLIRTIRRFGQPQKRIAVAASKEDMEEMQAFRGILDEFYDVQYLEENRFLFLMNTLLQLLSTLRSSQPKLCWLWNNMFSTEVRSSFSANQNLQAKAAASLLYRF